MADFVQRDGEYPRLPDAPKLISKSEPYPIVGFRKDDDEYPYIIGLPDVVPFESPTPYSLYIQRSDKLDGYPRIGVPEFLPFASPLPWLLFGQHPRILEGYPYIETPKIYKLFDRPIPFLFQKDALHPRCIKYTCRFIKSKSFKITLNCLKNDWCNTDIVKYKIPVIKQKKFTIYF